MVDGGWWMVVYISYHIFICLYDVCVERAWEWITIVYQFVHKSSVVNFCQSHIQMLN
jgi:hypothetical protein